MASESGVLIDEAVGDGGEVVVENFEASKEAPDQDHEAREVIIAVDEHLGVVTTDADTHSLRTKEHAASSFAALGGSSGEAFGALDGYVVAVLGHVGGFKEATDCYPSGFLSTGSTG